MREPPPRTHGFCSCGHSRTLNLSPSNLYPSDHCSYVKGIWVADQRAEGLRSGLDLRELRLDRDRRAILHASDVELQAAALWMRALSSGGSSSVPLLPRFYEMLCQPEPPPEVRRAQEFLTGSANELALEAIAAYFVETEGGNAVPVSAADASCRAGRLGEIESSLGRRAVVVNASLLALLGKSSAVPSLSALEAQAQTESRAAVALSSLHPAQLSVLQTAVGTHHYPSPHPILGVCSPDLMGAVCVFPLAGLVRSGGDHEFCMALMDLVEGLTHANSPPSAVTQTQLGMEWGALLEQRNASQASGVVSLPLQALDVAWVHSHAQLCSTAEIPVATTDAATTVDESNELIGSRLSDPPTIAALSPVGAGPAVATHSATSSLGPCLCREVWIASTVLKRRAQTLRLSHAQNRAWACALCRECAHDAGSSSTVAAGGGWQGSDSGFAEAAIDEMEAANLRSLFREWLMYSARASQF